MKVTKEKNLLIKKIDVIIPTISSLEIAEMMEIPHAKVLRKLEGDKSRKGIIDILNKNQMGSVDYFIQSTYVDAKNETRKCYECTKMGCELLANKSTGEKGVLFTAKYVKRFNELEQAQKPAIVDSYLIQDPIERAKRWIEEETVRLELKKDNEEKDLLLEAQKPKVEFADAVSSAQESVLVRELAKILNQAGIVGIGGTKLFALLRNYGYLIKKEGNDYNMPKQKYINMGIFEIKQNCICSPKGNKTSYTTKVTQKGVQYFLKKFKDGSIAV